MTQLKRNSLFNPNGDTDLRLRRMIGGNTTNLNDFNNMKYQWAMLHGGQAKVASLAITT